MPSKTLIIASTPRCGSHMLGHALYATKAFGFPLEYLNPANLAEWKRRLGTDATEQTLQEIQCRRTSPNGVFGIKIHYEHVKRLGGPNRLKAFFPNACYVLLNREDVLKQAVSLAIARQTGAWISSQRGAVGDPQYNFYHIDRCLRHTIRDNAAWRYLLASQGFNYMEVSFECARNNLAGVISQIGQFTGVDVDAKALPSQPSTKRQSSDINEQWERRYLAEHMGEELFDNGETGLVTRLRRKAKRYIF